MQKDRHTETFLVRLTPEQRAALDDLAEALGLIPLPTCTLIASHIPAGLPRSALQARFGESARCPYALVIRLTRALWMLAFAGEAPSVAQTCYSLGAPNVTTDQIGHTDRWPHSCHHPLRRARPALSGVVAPQRARTQLGNPPNMTAQEQGQRRRSHRPAGCCEFPGLFAFTLPQVGSVRLLTWMSPRPTWRIERAMAAARSRLPSRLVLSSSWTWLPFREELHSPTYPLIWSWPDPREH